MSYRSTPVRLIGGRLCLDFLNTADWSAEGEVLHEKLSDVQDLSTWCRAVDLGSQSGPKALSTTETILMFRGCLRRVFLAAMTGEKPKKKDLAHLNRVLKSGADETPLATRQGKLSFSKNTSLEQILALSAVGVLTAQQELARIKICPSADCGWLFLDESKNRRRRWCSMETCGNRAKARRHYQRQSG
ncbi:CGNR zinc finger domain-containing protein [Pelagibius sp. Alg239-R121]|uniref:CGNR zinc finger domain-containing protein n=1 Tax=Pelagibius sp. Alg239-R121 TaxID=2993448 RepID=UPI0024A7882F|nr:CGNR zinc finger domain-containing protein [Pelagibius sp. Alg239-R121]